MRIGDMALPAFDIKRAGLRAAAADLDAVAHRLLIRRFAEHTMVKLVASCGDPLQQLHRAVDRDVFLIASDEEGDRTFGLATVIAEILQDRGDAAGDAALHVAR